MPRLLSQSAVIAVLVVVTSTSSCMQLDGRKGEARISNETGSPIEVLWTAPGAEEVHYKDIPPRQVIGVFEYVSSCAPSNMVARTETGEELARTDEPLCPGDLWAIRPLAPGSPR